MANVKTIRNVFYTFTIALSAFLLFQIQPMVSKIILPLFGGGSSVWLTSLLFFQLLLLAGYYSSHALLAKLGPKRHLYYQAAVTLLSLSFITIEMRQGFAAPDFLPPSIGIFAVLFASVGLPYFMLSTTGPVIQYWIARGEETANPYMQYAVSNAGAILGLLAYPIIIEPILTTGDQTAIWSYGYIAYAILVFICMAIFATGKPGKAEHDAGTFSTGGVNSAQRHDWMIQALVPSTAMMVVTRYINLDIVNFPLLWVLPLCIYLLSLIICFTFPGLLRPGNLRTLIALLLTLAIILAAKGGKDIDAYWKIGIALTYLFSICIFFHSDLESGKPEKEKLTFFYLYLSIGGLIGSVFAVIIAPLLFDSMFELYVVIIAALYYIVLTGMKEESRREKRWFKYFIALIAVVAFINEEVGLQSDVMFKARSFYSQYKVYVVPGIEGKTEAVRLLVAGTQIQGGELLEGDKTAITYYHPHTGIGFALTKLDGIKDVGVVGLGAGVIASYGKKGQRFDFFEIDQTVIDIANERFNYLKESEAEIKTIVGDGRSALRNLPDSSYDMLVMDAFSSGAMPTHLITTEAVGEYLRVLRGEGLILYHISNRFVDLTPVLNSIALEHRLYIRKHISLFLPQHYMFASEWVALSKSKKAIEKLAATDTRWIVPPERKIYWSDEYSSLLPVLKIFSQADN